MNLSEDAILAHALDLPPGERRESYLREACGQRPDLRTGIETLLQAYGDGDFLESPAALTLAFDDSNEQESEAPGTVIGPYKIREQIGEGGFGLVYVAEQESPIRRKVALKVIKPGMDSKEIIARFSMERQTLAMMDHPNVAKVFDAGTTSSGRPYFVMELVPGVPITRFCDVRNLSLQARLKLMRDVCRAVQHAHLIGVIHRDIKPSNVLVTLHDGEPVVKVIDFGVAKALDASRNEYSVYTSFGQMVGTPLYMSPEQAEMSGLDIDTRSDVYSLGVLLYELLTGVTPFDRETLHKLPQDEFRRMIRETEPAQPSQRINSLDHGLQTDICRRRGVEVKKLRLDLRGDLDWIVMKALEKDRNRRYQSAGAFAADIENFLNGEPIEARPPSFWYLLNKRIYRHRFLVASVVLILFSLIAGTIASTWQAFRAIAAEQAAFQERDRARAAERDVLRLLYAADVHRAADAWVERDATGMHDALTRHLPRPEVLDIRGIEWYFLWGQKENISQTFWTGASAFYTIEPLPGNLLATAGADGMIRIFHEQTGQLVREFNSEQGELNCLALSPDGRLLASTGDDGTVVLRRYPSLETLWRVEAHQTQAFEVAFLPDGSALASCGNEPDVRIWDANTGGLVRVIPTDGILLESIRSNSQGIGAVGTNRGGVWIIDLQTGEILARRISEQDRSLAAFSHSGRLIVATKYPGVVTVRDRENIDKPLQTWFLPDSANSLAFSPDDHTLAVGDSSGAVHLLSVPTWEEESDGRGTWNVKSPAEPYRSWQAHGHRLYALTFGTDGHSLITGARDGKLILWRLQSDVTSKEPTEQADDLQFLQSGELLASTNTELRFVIGSQSQSENLRLSGTWLRFDTALGATSLLATRHMDSHVYQIAPDLSTSRILWSAETGSKCVEVALSPTGRQFAVEVESPEAQRLDPDASRFVELVEIPGNRSIARYPSVHGNQLLYSADGRLFCFLRSNTIQVVQAETGELLHSIEGHRSTVRHVAFHPQGRYLASVGGDRLLKVFDLSTGEAVWSVIAHKVSANAVTFSPDGLSLVTGGEDGLLKFWRWDSRRLTFEIPFPGKPIFEVSISPDSRKLAVRFRNSDFVVLSADSAGASGHRNKETLTEP